MNKKVSKRMKIVMRKNKSLPTCIFYEILGALNIALSAEIGTISLSAILFNLFSLSIVGANYVKISKEIEKEEYIESHEKEYKALKFGYDIYTDLVCSSIKYYKFEDDLQLCEVLDYLLYSGMFSSNGKYKYQNYKKEHEYYKDLLGAFVLTGNGVCRHATQFMIDILTKLDIKCFYITCKSKKSREYHALVGIISNDEKFVYDFTGHYFGVIENNKIHIVGTDFVYDIILTTMDSDELNAIPSKIITEEDVMHYTEGLEKYVDNLIPCFSILSSENEPIKKDISDRTLKLMPRK